MLDVIYQWFVDGAAFLVIKLATAWLETELFFIELAWDASKTILNTFTIYPQIQAAIDMLPEQYSGVLFYLGLDQILAIIIQALLTRFTLQAIGI